MSAAAFMIEIDAEFKLAEDELQVAVAKVATDALSRVVFKTPVDTGRARGNWFVEFGGSGVETTEAVDAGGGSTIARGAAKIDTYQNVEGWPIISLYNNLPYAERLENGYSSQAPAGMVAVTVAELSG